MMPLHAARLKALDEAGEDAVFRKYLEAGTTRAVAAAFFTPASGSSGDFGRKELFEWLQADEGRWGRWQATMKNRGHIDADLVLQTADDTTEENARSQRIKLDAHKWRAERLNREAYGAPNTQINVGVNLGSGWLDALRAIDVPTVEGKIIPSLPAGEPNDGSD